MYSKRLNFKHYFCDVVVVKNIFDSALHYAYYNVW